MIEKKSLFVFLLFLCGTISTSSPMQQEQDDQQEEWTIITEAAYFITHGSVECTCGSRKWLYSEPKNNDENMQFYTFDQYNKCPNNKLIPHHGLLLLYHDKDGEVLVVMNLAHLRWDKEKLLGHALKRLDPNVDPGTITIKSNTETCTKISYNTVHPQVIHENDCECNIF